MGRVRQLPDHGWVYVLFALANDHDFAPVAIQRACEPDLDGILYIGKAQSAGDLNERLGLLTGGLRTGHNRHPAAKRYHQCDTWGQRFPISRLAVGWLPTADGDDAWKRGEDFFDAYIRRFGETPPLCAAGGPKSE